MLGSLKATNAEFRGAKRRFFRGFGAVSWLFQESLTIANGCSEVCVTWGLARTVS